MAWAFSISASLSGRSSTSNKASGRSREIPNVCKTQNEMPLKLQEPLIYLITTGQATAATTPDSKEFTEVLRLVEAAARSQFSLLQLREKRLTARVLYELTVQAAEILRNSSTRLLVNDRADIAMAVGADGVHLTSSSIETAVVRQTFGKDFLIGVSTHSLADARTARDEQASFAVFGPVFATASKQVYGDPVGLGGLREAVSAVTPFPLLALGGVTLDNVEECFRGGAAGIAAIRLFQDPSKLAAVVARIREIFAEIDEDGPGH